MNRHQRPEPGVTEIRVHGVGGTTPESLLEQTGVTQVTGNDHAGMFRGAVGHPDRTVEAYSWGGLTSRSKSRAFWILLLPFSLVNIAGWMIEPARRHDASGTRHDDLTWERTLGLKLHEGSVQIVGILATSMYVMWIALLSMSIVAFQCGAIEQCYEGRWYLEYFGNDWFIDHPGRRILIGLVVPLLLLGLFVWIGRVSRTRYEDYGTVAGDTMSEHPSRSVLALPGFWSGGTWLKALTSLHIAGVFLLLGGLLARAAHEFEKAFGVDVVPDIGETVFYVSLALGVASGLALFVASYQSKLLLGHGVDWFPVVARLIMVASIGVLAIAIWLTLNLEVSDQRLVRTAPPGEAVEPMTDLWGFGWAPLMLLGLAALFIVFFSGIQLLRWFAWRQVKGDQLVIPLMLVFVALWEYAGVVAAVAFVLPFIYWIASQVLNLWRTKGWAGAYAIGPPPSPEAARASQWSAAVFVATAVIAFVVWLVTSDAGGGYGTDWPRFTPMLTFVVVLTILNLIQPVLAKLTTPPRPSEEEEEAPPVEGPVWKPPRVSLALVAIPVVLIGAGYLLGVRMDRDEWIYGAIGLAWTVLAIVWLAQFEFDGWRWNGPAAVAVMGLGILMGAASGGVIRLVDLLDLDGSSFSLKATRIYEWLAVGFVAFLIAGAVGMGVWYLLVRLGIGPPRPDGSPIPSGEALPEAIRALDVTVTIVTLLMATGALGLLMYLNSELGVSRVLDWVDQGTPEAWETIVNAASWITVGIAIGAFIAVRQGLKDSAFRTRLGILWDVASFWPRSFHPFAPPAYATRAVPELKDRVTEIAVDSKDDPLGTGRSCGYTLLSGHSQGSVLSIATVVQLAEPVQRRTWLTTHGSPLVRFYQRYFPRYFPDCMLEYCAQQLGDTQGIRDGAWLNYWRYTDPIGGMVFAGVDLGDEPVVLPDRVRSAVEGNAADGGVNIPDVRVRDPDDVNVERFQQHPGARGHSGYMAAPAMWGALDARNELLNQLGVACDESLDEIYRATQ